MVQNRKTSARPNMVNTNVRNVFVQRLLRGDVEAGAVKPH